MMIKVSEEAELRFSIAAGLHTAGRFSNAVYCKGKSILVGNTDHTVLLHFNTDQIFEEEVRFFANDYCGNEIEMVESGVIFYLKGKASDAKVLSRVPETTFSEVEKLYQNYKPEDLTNRITLSRVLLFEHLDENLSHIEFGCKDKAFFMIQRDLYSGRVIKAWPKPGRLNLFEVEGDWEFRGYRTEDVKALLNFVDKLSGAKEGALDMYFVDPFYSWVENKKLGMSGMITTCLYDELGELGILGEKGGESEYGRQKSQERGEFKASGALASRGSKKHLKEERQKIDF